MPLFCSKKKNSIPLWRQVQRNNFFRLEPLLDYLELSTENRKKILPHPKFALNLPLRLAEKIEKNNLEDPILRQFIPLEEELEKAAGFFTDPVQDVRFKKTKKIIHKYHGRALLVSTGACAMHCRYCFRQNFPYETEEKSFEEELSYLAADPSISEVILSGGDPLSLSDGTLAQLLHSLDSIAHLKRIRFHTRFPIGIPERIDASFLDLLASSQKQLFFIVHINHPKELDPEIIKALKKIQCLAIPVLNQSVLLKGVNDNPEILLSLSEALINSGIIPYYLHLLDPVQGTSHFETSPEKGKKLIQFVQEHLSGFGVPRLAQENPGFPSKTFV